ncbi:hypothetical protein [uncultured Bacteroides sp.]|uniref:hypothetical protein n=1 Tax=uncultured Bacteroides sp. TaxID=162156 RepID=UPI002638C432|nr:hypothetical protein [uncultured Bacteroides sp.]
MKCKITNFIKVERKNEIPYFVIKATGIDCDESAEVLKQDGCINPNAVMTVKFNFTKKLYPSTISQAEALEKMFVTDKQGNVVGDAPFIRLMFYNWITPDIFYIFNPNSVTGVYETQEEMKEVEEMDDGSKVKVTKIRYIPKIYSAVSLTLFETEDGTCAENKGDADELCRRNYAQGLASGSYLLCKSATHIKEVIREVDRITIPVERNNYDEWKDYYNDDYYNDGVDMDQQDERFWNF